MSVNPSVSRLAFIWLLAIMLTACGGGSGGGGQSASSTASTAPAVSISVLSSKTLLTGVPVTLSSKATGSNLTYSWNYGDGSAADTSSGASPTHTFVNSGSYPITVTVTDSVGGATASATATIVVLSPSLGVTVNANTSAPAQANQLVSFSSLVTQASTASLNYSWDFGDGSPKSANAQPNHIFLAAGTYVVSLTLTDSNLDIGTATTSITVNAATSSTTPSAQFSYSTYTNIANATSFIGAGTGVGALSYAWDFGDHSTGSGQTVNHIYASNGNYTVKLSVTDSQGNSANSSQVVAVATSTAGTPPSAQAIVPFPIRSMVNQVTTFTGLAAGGNGALSYAWNFGDGSSAAASPQNPVNHTYKTAGNFVVTLTVTDSLNRTATASATIVVAPQITTSVLAGILDSQGSADGTGTGAQFSAPSGTAVDGAGNIYVADTGNNTIRKVTPAGVVTTLAGAPYTFTNSYIFDPLFGRYVPGGCSEVDGTGAAARFCRPTALAVDAAGNVYATGPANTIRKITPAGVVSTLAGTTNYSGYVDGSGQAARFSNPAGLAVDAQNNLYVADTGNNTIRKVTPAGLVSTIAGSATSCTGFELGGNASGATFCSPTGIAVDGSGVIYVADANTGTIRKIDTSGNVTTLAGYPNPSYLNSGYNSCHQADGSGSNASFCSPAGLTLGGGTLYVADSSNNSIRAVSSTGTVTTVAGASRGYADGNGSVARFSSPTGIAIDSKGNIYVGDTGNNMLRKMTTGGSVSTLAGSVTTTSTSVDGTGTAARFATPNGIAADTAGNVYVADTATQTIRKITPAGIVTTLAGQSTVINNNYYYYNCSPVNGQGKNATFCNLQALAADANGNVFAIDGNSVREISSTGVVTTLAGQTSYPYNYNYCYYSPSNGQGTAASFCQPQSLATDKAGNVYVADTGDNLLREITPTGLVSTVAGVGGSASPCTAVNGAAAAATFCAPTGIALDKSGNIYVTDRSSNTVRKITPQGMVSTLAGTSGVAGWVDSSGSLAEFNAPSTMTINSNGLMYVADNNGLRAVATNGSVTTVFGLTAGTINYNLGYGFGYSGAAFMASMPNNQLVSSFGSNAIQVTSGL